MLDRELESLKRRIAEQQYYGFDELPYIVLLAQQMLRDVTGPKIEQIARILETYCDYDLKAELLDIANQDIVPPRPRLGGSEEAFAAAVAESHASVLQYVEGCRRFDAHVSDVLARATAQALRNDKTS